MLDIIIYYKDGRRSMYDHVIGIDLNGDDIGIDRLLDFNNDHIYIEIPAEQIDSIKVRIIKT